MCLAVPLEIKKINEDNTATVGQGTSELNVDISLIEEAAVGDYVIVHAGFAIEKLDLAEAEARIDLFQKMEN